MPYTTTQTVTPPDNCHIYAYNNGTNTFDCKVCKFGYTGPYNVNIPGNTICSTNITDCNKDIIYGGLFQFNHTKAKSTFNHLTCHECMTRGRIPFLFVKEDLSVSTYGIEFGVEELVDSNFDTGVYVRCEEPSALHFRIPEDRYDAKFPDNCAVGIFYTDIEIDYRTFK